MAAMQHLHQGGDRPHADAVAVEVEAAHSSVVQQSGRKRDRTG
jgi:hypothetical protein